MTDPVNPNILRVWYHAETKSNYCCNGGHTLKSIAYAESTNGVSFSKIGWPGNQIATIGNDRPCPAVCWQSNNAPGCVQTCSSECNQYGIGDHAVIAKDSYYYGYAGTTDNSSMGIIRSPN